MIIGLEFYPEICLEDTQQFGHCSHISGKIWKLSHQSGSLQLGSYSRSSLMMNHITSVYQNQDKQSSISQQKILPNLMKNLEILLKFQMKLSLTRNNRKDLEKSLMLQEELRRSSLLQYQPELSLKIPNLRQIVAKSLHQDPSMQWRKTLVEPLQLWRMAQNSLKWIWVSVMVTEIDIEKSIDKFDPILNVFNEIYVISYLL